MFLFVFRFHHRNTLTEPPRCITLMQTPVVASHSVRMELFWARFNQFTASLVLVAHFTEVM